MCLLLLFAVNCELWLEHALQYGGPVDIQVYKNVIKQFMIDYLQKTKRNSLTHVHRLS